MLKNIYVRNLITEKLVLIGPSGVGKSTLGGIIAEQLHWKFYDTDHQITQQSGMTCNDLIIKKGEIYFRMLEKEIILSLVEESYMDALKNEAILWLILEPLEIIEKRMTEKDTTERPLWNHRNALYSRRLPLYLKYADIVTTSDKDEILKETDQIKRLFNKIT